MFEARALTRRYRGFLAVDKVSFEIQRGEILGYLGPNGSGKSTTINMAVGLLEPSAGSIVLDGVSMSEDPVGCKRRIGYVPEEPYLYTHLTATEYLTLVGNLRGLARARLEARITRLLQLFALFESRYSALSAYSKGMRQRVLLAAALLHNPDLLVLDEPFSGLDVSAGLLFRTLLHLFAGEGRMILSAHTASTSWRRSARTSSSSTTGESSPGRGPRSRGRDGARRRSRICLLARPSRRTTRAWRKTSWA